MAVDDRGLLIADAVYDDVGAQIRRFWVTRGLPSEMAHQNGRYQLVFKADQVQRIAITP